MALPPLHEEGSGSFDDLKKAVRAGTFEKRRTEAERTTTALTPECHAEFRRINLRWHDLRHEYASRLVEKNVPLAQVRDLLGHASIITTERYDNQKLENLQAAAPRLERGETFDPGARDSTSPSICQVSVKSSADAEPGEQIDRARETALTMGMIRI